MTAPDLHGFHLVDRIEFWSNIGPRDVVSEPVGRYEEPSYGTVFVERYSGTVRGRIIHHGAHPHSKTGSYYYLVNRKEGAEL